MPPLRRGEKPEMASADCQTNFDIDILQNLILDGEYVQFVDSETEIGYD